MIAPRLLLSLAPLVAVSCSSAVRKETGFVSPSGALKFRFERHGPAGEGGYVLVSGDREVAKVPTILDEELIRNDSSLPLAQKIMWSPSERAIAIYEDMSSALPFSVSFLLQRNPSGQDWAVSELKLEKRPASDPAWTESPTPEGVTDDKLLIYWPGDKSHASIPLSAVKRQPPQNWDERAKY